MSIKSKLISSVAAIMFATSASADPDHMILYVPASGDEAGIAAIYAQVADRLINIEPDQRLQVIANPGLTQIFDLYAPVEMPSHPAWKQNFVAKAMASLQAYARSAFQAGLSDGAIPPNQVGLHQIIAELPRRAHEGAEVIVFGSPRDNHFNDPSNTTLTRVPNDAFLDLAAHSSPFGTRGLEGSLNGLRVHVCVIDEGFVDPRHNDLLSRFTALRLQAMGGDLATWSVDLDECLGRANAERQDGMPVHIRDDSVTEPMFLNVDQAGSLPTADAQQQGVLLKELNVPASVEAVMASKIAEGSLRLVAIKLYDTDGEDGDAVLIKTDDVEIEVDLVNRRQRYVVPIENGNLTIIGLRDGRGGITVGIETDDGTESLTPNIKVGETVIVPFFQQ